MIAWLLAVALASTTPDDVLAEKLAGPVATESSPVPQVPWSMGTFLLAMAGVGAVGWRFRKKFQPSNTTEHMKVVSRMRFATGSELLLVEVDDADGPRRLVLSAGPQGTQLVADLREDREVDIDRWFESGEDTPRTARPPAPRFERRLEEDLIPGHLGRTAPPPARLPVEEPKMPTVPQAQVQYEEDLYDMLGVPEEPVENPWEALAAQVVGPVNPPEEPVYEAPPEPEPEPEPEPPQFSEDELAALEIARRRLAVHRIRSARATRSAERQVMPEPEPSYRGIEALVEAQQPSHVAELRRRLAPALATVGGEPEEELVRPVRPARTTTRTQTRRRSLLSEGRRGNVEAAQSMIQQIIDERKRS